MDQSFSDLSRLSESEALSMLADIGRNLVLGGGSRLSPVFLVSMVLICAAIWVTRKPGQGFWAWAFPRRVYATRSFVVDLQLWLLSIALRAVGFFSLVAFAPALTNALQTFLAGDTAPNSTWPPLVIGALMLCALDGAGYWVHRLFHEIPRLWPFHAVHHSAEQLNPVTLFRKHPVYNLLASLVHSLVTGILQGLLLGLLIGKVEVATLMGVNLFYYAFNLAGANLRHTHIWLSWGPVLEHLFISPAQHQVHHSINPRHFNKNYGEVLAIWDWAFGTLYVPKQREALEFGLADMRGNRISQPHGTLRAALVEPVVTALSPRKRKTRAREGRLGPGGKS